MHAYWKVADAQAKQIDMINFTKNMALVGALLMFLLAAASVADESGARLKSIHLQDTVGAAVTPFPGTHFQYQFELR